MADVDREVVTTFTVKDEQTAAITKMEKAGKAASVSMSDLRRDTLGVGRSVDIAGAMFGDRGAGMRQSMLNVGRGAAEGAMQFASSFASAGVAAVSAVVGFAVPAMSSIMSIGSEAENTRLVLGGMFQAFGYASTFEGGMQVAAQSIERIETAAAALPGEAQDYLTVFQGAFAAIETNARATLDTMDLSVIGSTATDSVGRMTDLSNSITALGSTWGMSSQVVGRQFSLMLAGRAGEGTTLLRNMMPYMQQVEGQAGLTAQAFRRMTAPERVRILVAGIGKLSPMLRASATSWDAMTGSLSTAFKQIVRGGTAPIFDRAKGVLGDINNLISVYQSRIISLGASISTALVGGFNNTYKAIMRVGQSPIFGQLQRFGAHMGRSALRIVTSTEGAAGVSGAAALATGGPMGLLITSTVMALVTNGKLLEATLGGLMTVFSQGMAFVEPLLMTLGAVSTVLGNFTAAALPGFLEGIANIISILRAGFAPIMQIGHDLFTWLAPPALALGGALGNLVGAFTGLVIPIITLFSTTMRYVWSIVGEYVRPILVGFVNMMASIINGLADALRWLGRSIGRVTAIPIDNMRASMSRDITTASEQAARTAAEQAANAAATGAARPTAPAARGGSNTHNDFRNSRFDITQKFAEGFDEDRIAVSFVRDLETMASARLQSSFAPLFNMPGV